MLPPSQCKETRDEWDHFFLARALVQRSFGSANTLAATTALTTQSGRVVQGPKSRNATSQPISLQTDC